MLAWLRLSDSGQNFVVFLLNSIFLRMWMTVTYNLLSKLESLFMSQHTGSMYMCIKQIFFYTQGLRSVACATTADVSDRTA